MYGVHPRGLRFTGTEIVDLRELGGVWLFPFDGLHFEPFDRLFT